MPDLHRPITLPAAQLALFPPALPTAPGPGSDPWGDAYCSEHSPAARRGHGITLTPPWLVQAMFNQLGSENFDTVVDAGAGSGRFVVAAARRFPRARIVAVEPHPDMLGLLRQALLREGLSERVHVVAGDFRDAQIALEGRCLFIGNPPYVRHHDIDASWKAWYRDRMRSRGIAASQLAGLHLHFLLRAADLMRAGDALCYVTSSEWLDNGYGSAARALLGRGEPLTLKSLWVAEPGEAVFPDALVSAAVFHAECSVPGASASVKVGVISGGALREVRTLPAAALAESQRWSVLTQATLPSAPVGIELGELFQVTRGQVTGNNGLWVLPSDQVELPRGLTVAAVTRAREIIDGSVALPVAVPAFRRVVQLPRELDALTAQERVAAERFIERARALGGDQSYIARHRKPWFAIDMRRPPAAFVSYMGRRSPVFAANPAGLSFINIAHGLYPRAPMSATSLHRILAHLNRTTRLHDGRVYGGGMAKFEPSDVARLRIPASVLAASA